MAVYDLSGSGVQLLSPSITRLFVEVLVFPVGYSIGRATPVNYFDVGLLRVGVDGSYGRVIPIDAGDMFVDLPAGATSLGFNCFDSTIIRVSESIPIIPPGTGATFMPLLYAPLSTYTDTAGISLGQMVNVADAGYSITALRYWRPPSDTSGPLLEAAIYGTFETDLLYHETVSLAGFGWNEWTVGPFNVDAFERFVLVFQSFAGRVRANPGGDWDGRSVGTLTTSDCLYKNSETLVLPDLPTTAYGGIDCRIAVP